VADEVNFHILRQRKQVSAFCHWTEQISRLWVLLLVVFNLGHKVLHLAGCIGVQIMTHINPFGLMMAALAVKAVDQLKKHDVITREKILDLVRRHVVLVRLSAVYATDEIVARILSALDEEFRKLLRI
jgi:hypothetical protein